MMNGFGSSPFPFERNSLFYGQDWFETDVG